MEGKKKKEEEGESPGKSGATILAPIYQRKKKWEKGPSARCRGEESAPRTRGKKQEGLKGANPNVWRAGHQKKNRR